MMRSTVGTVVNQDVLVGQPIPEVVRDCTADDWGKAKPSNYDLSEITRKYAQANFRKASWQVLDTFIPYGVLWALMLHAVRQEYPYWITLALAVIAAGLLVRIFILFHDCCHGSFLPSRRANSILGHISAILIFTPFADWRYTHAIHHATAGDLDRRGTGDIWTMTAEEYLAAPRRKRLAYRIYRNPFILFIAGPVLLFLFVQRFSSNAAKKRERIGVAFTNLAILLVVVVASFTIGLRTYLLIQFPVIAIAGSLGLWLFYLQHQFENVYWARHESWDPARVALQGSSYLKLPKIVQWFTGNIGLHHIHHARPTIPNYNLQRCYDDLPAFRAVEPLTIRTSLNSAWLSLYDEDRKKLVSFGALRLS
ncbi:MAG: fatty acid desaturase [Candidatus Binatia bacterium]